jgi:hypothetical protein
MDHIARQDALLRGRLLLLALVENCILRLAEVLDLNLVVVNTHRRQSISHLVLE